MTKAHKGPYVPNVQRERYARLLRQRQRDIEEQSHLMERYAQSYKSHGNSSTLSSGARRTKAKVGSTGESSNAHRNIRNNAQTNSNDTTSLEYMDISVKRVKGKVTRAKRVIKSPKSKALPDHVLLSRALAANNEEEEVSDPTTGANESIVTSNATEAMGPDLPDNSVFQQLSPSVPLDSNNTNVNTNSNTIVSDNTNINNSRSSNISSDIIQPSTPSIVTPHVVNGDKDRLVNIIKSAFTSDSNSLLTASSHVVNIDNLIGGFVSLLGNLYEPINENNLLIDSMGKGMKSATELKNTLNNMIDNWERVFLMAEVLHRHKITNITKYSNNNSNNNSSSSASGNAVRNRLPMEHPSTIPVAQITNNPNIPSVTSSIGVVSSGSESVLAIEQPSVVKESMPIIIDLTSDDVENCSSSNSNDEVKKLNVRRTTFRSLAALIKNPSERNTLLSLMERAIVLSPILFKAILKIIMAMIYEIECPISNWMTAFIRLLDKTSMHDSLGRLISAIPTGVTNILKECSMNSSVPCSVKVSLMSMKGEILIRLLKNSDESIKALSIDEKTALSDKIVNIAKLREFLSIKTILEVGDMPETLSKVKSILNSSSAQSASASCIGHASIEVLKSLDGRKRAIAFRELLICIKDLSIRNQISSLSTSICALRTKLFKRCIQAILAILYDIESPLMWLQAVLGIVGKEGISIDLFQLISSIPIGIPGNLTKLYPSGNFVRLAPNFIGDSIYISLLQLRDDSIRTLMVQQKMALTSEILQLSQTRKMEAINLIQSNESSEPILIALERIFDNNEKEQQQSPPIVIHVESEAISEVELADSSVAACSSVPSRACNIEKPKPKDVDKDTPESFVKSLIAQSSDPSITSLSENDRKELVTRLSQLPVKYLELATTTLQQSDMLEETLLVKLQRILVLGYTAVAIGLENSVSFESLATAPSRYELSSSYQENIVGLDQGYKIFMALSLVSCIKDATVRNQINAVASQLSINGPQKWILSVKLILAIVYEIDCPDGTWQDILVKKIINKQRVPDEIKALLSSIPLTTTSLLSEFFPKCQFVTIVTGLPRDSIYVKLLQIRENSIKSLSIETKMKLAGEIVELTNEFRLSALELLLDPTRYLQLTDSLYTQLAELIRIGKMTAEHSQVVDLTASTLPATQSTHSTTPVIEVETIEKPLSLEEVAKIEKKRKIELLLKFDKIKNENQRIFLRSMVEQIIRLDGVNYELVLKFVQSAIDGIVDEIEWERKITMIVSPAVSHIENAPTEASVAPLVSEPLKVNKTKLRMERFGIISSVVENIVNQSVVDNVSMSSNVDTDRLLPAPQTASTIVETTYEKPTDKVIIDISSKRKRVVIDASDEKSNVSTSGLNALTVPVLYISSKRNKTENNPRETSSIEVDSVVSVQTVQTPSVESRPVLNISSKRKKIGNSVEDIAVSNSSTSEVAPLPIASNNSILNISSKKNKLDNNSGSIDLHSIVSKEITPIASEAISLNPILNISTKHKSSQSLTSELSNSIDIIHLNEDDKSRSQPILNISSKRNKQDSKSSNDLSDSNENTQKAVDTTVFPFNISSKRKSAQSLSGDSINTAIDITNLIEEPASQPILNISSKRNKQETQPNNASSLDGKNISTKGTDTSISPILNISSKKNKASDSFKSTAEVLDLTNNGPILNISSKKDKSASSAPLPIAVETAVEFIIESASIIAPVDASKPILDISSKRKRPEAPPVAAAEEVDKQPKHLNISSKRSRPANTAATKESLDSLLSSFVEPKAKRSEVEQPVKSKDFEAKPSIVIANDKVRSILLANELEEKKKKVEFAVPTSRPVKAPTTSSSSSSSTLAKPLSIGAVTPVYAPSESMTPLYAPSEAMTPRVEPSAAFTPAFDYSNDALDYFLRYTELKENTNKLVPKAVDVSLHKLPSQTHNRTIDTPICMRSLMLHYRILDEIKDYLKDTELPRQLKNCGGEDCVHLHYNELPDMIRVSHVCKQVEASKIPSIIREKLLEKIKSDKISYCREGI